jgi:hypothetical protein
LGLGSPAHTGAQSPFPENRHRFSSHDQPYCLGCDEHVRFYESFSQKE